MGVLDLDERVATDTPLIRALRTLELISSRPGISGDGIAARLGVSTRAARRAVSALREAGLGIVSTPGPGGGYQLRRGSSIPLVFSADELMSLAIILGETPPSAAEGAARSAASRILRAVPARAAAPAQAILDAATAVPSATGHRPQPHIVLSLVQAIDQGRRVEIGYEPVNGGEAASRVVEPWAVVVRHRRRYLLGRSVEHGATRTYRVDRIGEVQVLQEPATRPADLDAQAVLEEHLRSSWNHPTEVLLRAGVDEVRPWIPATMGTLTAEGAKRCRLTGSTSTGEGYLLDLARTPFDFTVVGGDELHAAAERLAARLTAAARAEPVR